MLWGKKTFPFNTPEPMNSISAQSCPLGTGGIDAVFFYRWLKRYAVSTEIITLPGS